MKHLNLIAAVSRNGVIGARGTLPWHLPEDFKYFKETTLGHAVIMGRKTFESIGKPLPHRRNIVVSRGLSVIGERLVGMVGGHLTVCSSLSMAIVIARETDPTPFVIGGAALYAEALPLVDRMFITEVHRDVDGDVLFPKLDRSEWIEISRRDTAEYSWVVFDRKQGRS